MASVSFDNKKIKFGELITQTKAQGEIKINFDVRPKQIYTIIMYDIDAIKPNTVSKPFCHFLAINVNSKNEYNELIEYYPPNPPLNDKPHTYYVDIYLQSYIFDDYNKYENQKFNLKSFIDDHDLTLYESTYFIVQPNHGLVKPKSNYYDYVN